VIVTGVENGEVVARASWIVHSFGQRGALTRGGSYEYRLRREDRGLRIASKKIILIDDKLVGPVDIFHV
jgi:3-phenylpropionate/cinnamic acid dioxygenase small subunit